MSRKKFSLKIRGWLPYEHHLNKKIGIMRSYKVVFIIVLLASSSVGSYASYNFLNTWYQSQAATVPPNTPTTPGLSLYDYIHILSNGSLSPLGAYQVLRQNGNVFSFTANILNSIMIERNNTILDGSGYSLQGPGRGTAVSVWANNCTIRNINIVDWNGGIEGLRDNNSIVTNNITATEGILVYANNFRINENTLVGRLVETSNRESLTGIEVFGNFSSIEENKVNGFYTGVGVFNGVGNSVIANQITDNSEGLTLSTPVIGNIAYSRDIPTVVYGNNVSNCDKYGVLVQGYHSITVFGNNFTNNTKQAVDGNKASGLPPAVEKWDNGTEGNYWSDYLTNYPEATEIDHSGIGNIPYNVYSNNTDNYPLLWPITIG